MPSTAVIELDIATPWQPPDRRGRRAWWGGSRPARLRFARRWLAVGLTLTTLLASGGGAAPQRLDPVFIVRGVDGLSLLGGRFLFVLRQNADTAVAEAYRLTDGKRAWVRQLSGLAAAPVLAGDRLLLSTMDKDGLVAGIAVLDGVTGRPLWQHTSARFAGLAGDVAVIDDLAPADEAVPGEPVEAPRPARQMAGLAIASGDPLWRVGIPAGTISATQFNPSGGGTFTLAGLVELDRDGALRVRDPVTGNVRSRASIDPPGPLDNVALAAGLVLVQEHDGKGIRAYDPHTGRLLWRQPVSLDPSSLFLDSCGRFICEGDQLALSALDPATGKPAWRIDRLRYWYPVDAGHGIAYDFGASPGGGNAAVINPETGASESTLAPWRLAGDQRTPRVLTWQRDPGGALMLAARDVRSGGVTVLARASAWYSSAWCQTAGRYLACIGESSVGVWRLG